MLWASSATSREIGAWRERAAAIPDTPLRADALSAITHKREHAEGAALFWTLPTRRDPGLLRLLVTTQTIGDFLDNASEREVHSSDTKGRGHRLHRALVEALDPGGAVSDYYSSRPRKDDSGYLRALVDACRQRCAALPSYHQVRAPMLRGAARCSVQDLNHDPDPARRDMALTRWAAREYPAGGTSWFELTAAAGAFTPHVFLALAAEPFCDALDIAAADSVYSSWFALAVAMLDSYVDALDDAASGDHSYISHYADPQSAVGRLREIVAQTARGTRELRHGHRHAVIAAAMVAMYLSKDTARGPSRRKGTSDITRAGGSLTQALAPVLRLWRTTHIGRTGSTGPQGGHRVPPRALPGDSRSPAVVQTFLCWRAPLAYLERARRRHGPRFTYRQPGHPPLVFLSDPQDIGALFKAPADVLHPGEGGETIMPIVGPSSFMLLDEDEHLQGRKTVLPAFHGGIVRHHAEMVGELVRREIATWPLDTPFALHPRLRALTLRIILRTIFASGGAATDERLSALHERLLAALSVTASVVFPEPLLRHGPGLRIWKRFLRERAEADALIYALIDERYDASRGENLLDMLIAADNSDGTPMSREQIRDNVMSMILAGHETTSSELAWAFQLLAHHPDVLDRLTDEIDRDAGEEYLTATIQEVLRHRPVFLFAIPRAVKQPIDIGGFTYRPPTQLLACIYLVHHDPELYPNPDEFRPERFMGSPPQAPLWLPWGGGRKRCPGLHLAMLEMKTVLRTVLSERTVRPAAARMEHPRWRSVVVTPHAGSRVVLERRHGTGPLNGTPSRQMPDRRRSPSDPEIRDRQTQPTL